MIHHHIDVGTVLRGAVCNLYSNLVTRPTGAAVRTEIERTIAEAKGPTVTVIDFSQVMLLDFSCADEIVAKLMLRASEPASADGYVVFHGLCDRHLDAVEQVLERHGLAIVAVLEGTPTLFGDVDAETRGVWDMLRDVGPTDAATLARALAAPAAPVAERLEFLAARRLVARLGAAYAALGTFGPPPAPEAAA